jgi:SAM-dependent methyltransferase
MNGAHRLAHDYILAAIRGRERVLDLGAGADTLSGILAKRGCGVLAADIDANGIGKSWRESSRNYETSIGDATTPEWWTQLRGVSFDLVVAKYSIQHMLGRQAFVWSEVARSLKSRGRFIHVGRYREDAPVYERDRDDPLLADNEGTIKALAMNCGIEVVDFVLYRYDADAYKIAGPDTANAMISVMVKP